MRRRISDRRRREEPAGPTKTWRIRPYDLNRDGEDDCSPPVYGSMEEERGEAADGSCRLEPGPDEEGGMRGPFVSEREARRELKRLEPEKK